MSAVLNSGGAWILNRSVRLRKLSTSVELQNLASVVFLMFANPLFLYLFPETNSCSVAVFFDAPYRQSNRLQNADPQQYILEQFKGVWQSSEPEPFLRSHKLCFSLKNGSYKNIWYGFSGGAPSSDQSLIKCI